MSKEPWSKFFWADWRGDTKLRLCSLAARGLWIELLSIMHESAEYGHLLINGKSPTEQQLAIICGATLADVRNLREELKAAGVPSIKEDGTWFSRRMLRDKGKRERDKANGSMGGNPNVKPREKVGVNPPVDPEGVPEDGLSDKAHATRDPEARDQKPEDERDKAVAEAAARPTECLLVIKAFDEARVEVFGENKRRLFPAADDLVFAERFTREGCPLDWLKAFFVERMSKRKESGQDAPAGLRYFEKAVPEAQSRMAAAKSNPLTSTAAKVEYKSAYAGMNREEMLAQKQRAADTLARLQSRSIA